MKFGTIDKFILFGGGRRLVNFILAAAGYKVLVASAPRLLSAPLEGEAGTVEEYFTAHQIPFFNVEDISAFPLSEYLTETTLGISFGAPWIFKKEFIDKFKGRLLNGHGMCLPKNRGGGGFSWQIMRGERSGCHLLHQVDYGIDTGPIILRQNFEFLSACQTPADYRKYFQETEVEFFRDFLDKLKADFEFKDIAQDEEQSTYFPRLSTLHHGWVDWNWGAQEIQLFISAFDEPHQGASSFLDGRRVFLKQASVDGSEGGFHPFMNGLVFRVRLDYIAVAARDGAVRIRAVSDEQGISILDKIRAGSRLFTPLRFLEEACQFKAVYTPRGLKEF